MTPSIASFRPHRLALASAVLFSVPIVVLAGPVVTAPNAPTAGQLLQQVPTPANAVPSSDTGLTVQAPASASSSDTTPIPVKQIVIKGNTVVDTATLHALVADGEGKTLTLGQVDDIAKRIADYYHAHGYLLARAVVPPQNVSDGLITIQVVEAHYDKITVENHSRVSTSLLQSTLGSLQPPAAVKQQALDRALLLMGDIPGTVTRATLAPGQLPGTTDLNVVVDPGPMLWGQAGVDDEGDRYTGRVRGFASLGINDLLHWGDVLNLDAMTTGRGMNWGKLTYQSVLNGLGTQAGASYSFLDYKLGGSLSPINGYGTAGVASAWVDQPFIRSKTLNLNGKLEYDHRQLDDVIGSVQWYDKRHVDSVALSLNGDSIDSVLGGGLNRATLQITRGHVGFDNTAAEAADAAAANTRGYYTSWSGGINRLQNLPYASQLYLSFSFQHGNRNLDSSEQWLLGGPGTVRGYRVSTLSGVNGALETVELRRMFAVPMIKQIQASLFFDAGQMTIDAYPWQSGQDHANLMSLGLGLDWANANGWSAKLMLAKPVGQKVEIAGDRPGGEIWAQVIKRF